MGKAVGVSSPSQKQVEMKGVLGKHIGRYLDQYTFMCVFGSVLGYAVMPLIGVSVAILLEYMADLIDYLARVCVFILCSV